MTPARARGPISPTPPPCAPHEALWIPRAEEVWQPGRGRTRHLVNLGAEPLAGSLLRLELYGSGSYAPDGYDSDLYGSRAEPALTPAGGVPVTPREPRDAAGEPGPGRAAGPSARPRERPGTRGGHPGEP